MNYPKNLFYLSIIFLFSAKTVTAQLFVNAGVDTAVCPGGSITLGGYPIVIGGVAPYTYKWTPSTGLSSSTIAHPLLNPTTYTNYTITVTDNEGHTQSNSVFIYMTDIAYIDAGKDTSICIGTSTPIGNVFNIANNGINYSWSPSTGLNDSTSARPIASPLLTTTYTLTAFDGVCQPKISFTKVTVIPIPQIHAGSDTTIFEGAVATLHATGGFNYVWYPQTSLTYPYTANPNAEPIQTTDYFLYGEDNTGKCFSNDTITVTVTPENAIVIYNTFTPNNDSNNDNWYIGNIWKYPNNKLEVYNRFGKIVYKKNSYLNDWDGKSYGIELPAATYFYILDLGDGKVSYHGTVSIVR